MPVRKTESRIPAALQPADLGDSVTAPDGRSVLVSQTASPLVVGRDAVFVLFVTDAALATQVARHDWTVTPSGGQPTTQATQIGEFVLRPTVAGSVTVTVDMKSAANASLGQVTQVLDVVEANAELEALITAARNESGPTMSSPDVSRELINDLEPYYRAVRLAGADDENFTRFVFMQIHDSVLHRTTAERKTHLDRLAGAINDGTFDYGVEAALAGGVAGMRLPLLAMVMPVAAGGQPALVWTELAEDRAAQAVEEEALLRQLTGLAETARIDLFNGIRFPKAAIRFSARAFEALRDRYFPGAGFDQMGGSFAGTTRGHWMIRHYREGPVRRN